MTKITHVFATTIAVLSLLAGCANITPQAQAVTPDQAYIEAVHSAAPSLNDTEDSVLIGSGHGVCKALDHEITPQMLSDNAVRRGLTRTEGDAIIKAAIDNYCPEHAWSVDV